MVDDDEDLPLLVPHLLKKALVSFSFRFANNGERAVEYLHGTGAYADRAAYPLPQILLLDLKDAAHERISISRMEASAP